MKSLRRVGLGPGRRRGAGAGARRRTYVVVGHYTDAGPSRIDAHQHINRKHLDLRGCWGSEAGHFLRALRVLERHARRLPWHEIGARACGLDGINQALEAAEADEVPKLLVRP